MRKARELENEMMKIRQAKLDVVVKQFEVQLQKEAEEEERRHLEMLRDKYEDQVKKIDLDKQLALEDI